MAKKKAKKSTALQAVAYYRHSAQDRQENSVEIQQDHVRRFAKENGIHIIKEFADRGKSGLSAEGRDAFNEMIDNYVQVSREEFQYVLVLDVSRWGRFQDTDLSAYYTGLCAKHGKQVVFTSIGFPKNDDLLHGLHLSIERYRAASYSRELSGKVFNGCAKIAEQGFRAGGSPPFGLRRLLLDEQRNPVQVLEIGQRKSIQNQRVTLTPGPSDEVEIINAIFISFVEEGQSQERISASLNNAGVHSPGDRRWTAGSVASILENELYAGTMVYNKTTQRMKSPSKRNPESEWIRTPNSFSAIVEPSLFNRAQEIITKEREERRLRYSSKEMIDRLRILYEEYGTIRPSLVQFKGEMVSPATYADRFGSLRLAYQEIHKEIIDRRRNDVINRLREHVAKLEVDGEFLVLNGMAYVYVQPAIQFPEGYEASWPFLSAQSMGVDLTIAVPLSNGAEYSILGYLAFPRGLPVRQTERLLSTLPDRMALHSYSLPEIVEFFIGSENAS